MICSKRRPNPFSGSKCEDAWFDVVNTCFRIFAGILKTWDGARDYCLRQGGDLAVVDSETKRKAIASRVTHVYTWRLFIGIRKKGASWQWSGDKNISSAFWHPGFPNSGACVALDKRSHDWKLFTTSCFLNNGFLCQTTERKYFLLV